LHSDIRKFVTLRYLILRQAKSASAHPKRPTSSKLRWLCCERPDLIGLIIANLLATV
jgi:hypothetical protein